MLVAFLLTTGLLGPARADERAEAEHLRLSGELDQLSQRQLWTGVDKKFQELEKLGVELTYEDLLHGAYAARALGNINDAYQRLKRAAKLDSTKEVVDWLYAIDSSFGSVELVRTPKHTDALTVEAMPFDPDQRAAVEHAIAAVGDNGQFSGLLPKGNYTFCGQPFIVQPGIAIRIEVSPRMKKTQGIVVNVKSTPTWGSGAEDSGTAPPAGEPPK